MRCPCNQIIPMHCTCSGLIAHFAGRNDVAAEFIGRALRIKPDNAMAHSNMAIVLRAQGKFDQAEAECREAIRLKPLHPEAFTNLGNILTDQGRFAEAASAYRQAIQLQPGNPKTHTSLGSALSDAGKLDEAIGALIGRQAIQITLEMAGAHWNLAAGVVTVQGDFDGWTEYHEWRWKFDGFSSPGATLFATAMGAARTRTAGRFSSTPSRGSAILSSLSAMREWWRREVGR